MNRLDVGDVGRVALVGVNRAADSVILEPRVSGSSRDVAIDDAIDQPLISGMTVRGVSGHLTIEEAHT
jgi:hypothetical protein